ncbi:hypothetical protein CLIB1444_06S01310 [[Candida] jaroonii]|uniref:Uncharacterized protein n=1 Tax=[Candida] jaroonii TaxID=467808 RepID=A0ACA9Y8N4_9ASCO|nr:hypothetical protein CLIB1444_06S01310 [[Candida] jaroonii]
MTIDNTSISPKKHRDSFSSNINVDDSYHRCFQNYYHGHNYLNPNPKYITNVKSNVNHWQLRDLIKINQNSGDVFYTKSYSIWKLGLKTNSFSDSKSLMSKEILKPDYSPRCFDITNDNKMVIGGLMTSAYKIFYSNIEGLSVNNQKILRPQKGLFTFCNNDLNVYKTVKIGEMINNSVSVYNTNDTNMYKSYVCNNDSSLYCIDILNNDKLSIHNKIICEHDVSLNNVAKNPVNEKNLIVTGDSPSIFLIDPTMKNSKINTIKTNNDSGFGISFHPNGHLFSTSFQNGHCLVYDLRSVSQPLKEIKSTRPGHQSGAFRCCKFSNNSFSDLLVVSEHVGRVHLIDLRNLNDDNHQVIIFPFALDQFGDYKSKKIIEDSENDLKSNKSYHHNLDIYEDESKIKFNAPLVYDFDYLTNVNPKLFKYYTYQPTKQHIDIPSNPSSPSVPLLSSFQDTYNMPLDFDGSTTDSYNSDSYQHSDNHIYGEMELSGLDWYDNKLVIGCENGGLFSWDVNYIARRSFGSFSFV